MATVMMANLAMATVNVPLTSLVQHARGAFLGNMEQTAPMSVSVSMDLVTRESMETAHVFAIMDGKDGYVMSRPIMPIVFQLSAVDMRHAVVQVAVEGASVMLVTLATERTVQ